MGCPDRYRSNRKRGKIRRGVVSSAKVRKITEESSESGNESKLNISASSSKISHSLGENKFELDHDEVGEGFLLIDAQLMCNFLNTCVKCPSCNNNLECRPLYLARNGFALRVIGHCEDCQLETCLFETSKRCGSSGIFSDRKQGPRPCEINERMVCFARDIGLGQSCLTSFCQHLNMPEGLGSTRSYGQLFDHHHTAFKEIASESQSQAAAELKEHCGEEVTVSCDGSWQRRGHCSHNGLATIISVETGKCIDAEIMSDKCKSCEHWEKIDKESDEYIDWADNHVCLINHDGSAGAMEACGMVKMFSQSEQLHGLQYTNYLGDGDSSSYKKVVEAKPYGDKEIVKLECVGHVQKRMGCRLRKLRDKYRGQKLKDGKGFSGAGRLTDKKIDTLQNYYGLAIRKNRDNLISMQQDVLASLYHVASSDSNPNHHMCPSEEDSWCGYNRDPENYSHKHGLPQVIVDLLEPIYNDLSDATLLGKCLHGKTQNNNECINKVIWSHCPKETYVGRDVVEDAVYISVALFNDGHKATVNKLYHQLGFNPGKFTQMISAKRDSERIYFAERQSSEAQKKERKHKRAVKKGFVDQRSQKEGNVYEAGGH